MSDKDTMSEPLVLPLDEHNRRLLEHVHPAGYVNPSPRARYHLVVLGAGTGGLVTAAIAAALGARVALVEKRLTGGDCLNVGCVPSKAILRAARAWSEARRSAERFGGPSVAGDGDFAAVMERMRRLRADLAAVDSVARFRSLGVDVFIGEGRFASPDTIEVEGARLRFRRAVIATGGRPAIPDVPGLAACAPLTNETVFWLTKRPRRLAVVGGGPIGCELAQAFARFGSEVTLVQRAPRLLPREDPEAGTVVARALERDGVRVRPATRLLSARRDGGGFVLTLAPAPDGEADRPGAESIGCDRVLVAAGRIPNVEALALDKAGIAANPQGVEVNRHLRTANRRVFAVGDVSSPWKFTHAADAQARLVVRNALFFGRARADALVMPWCTYTEPEVARVGLSEVEAKKAGIAVDTVTIPLQENDRAVLDDAAEGFLRIRLHRGSDRIAGALIVADHAGDLLAPLTLAMTAGLGLGRMGSAIPPYPTQGEAIRRAADAHNRTRLTPRTRRLFELFFRLFG
jgi:pyruvate/2-oxoglutarate dehydrogenase complex dihydrolipoamide dehydrogenase (E3) component